MNRYILTFFVSLLLNDFVSAAPVVNICSSTFSNEDSGTIYDSGGASQPYSNNENCGFLIQPASSPNSITLNFSQLQLEQNYDFLRVYDGNNAAGTLLGQYTGSSIPNAITATSGSMYLHFLSDFSVTSNGFTASWESKTGPNGTSCTTDNVRDTFPNSSYNNNSGSQNWTAAWQEVGEADGPSAGQARVSNSNCSSAYCLRIGTPSGVFSGQYTNRGASREINLTDASSATLTFNYFTGYGGGTANVSLQTSNNGGSTWTTLKNYPINSTSFSANPESFDLTPYIGTNTQIRFIGSGSSGSTTGMYIDDISIDYEVCPPQNNLDHFELSYTKNGLACLPSDITVKACADASCTTLITDDVEVTFSPATGWKNNPVTVSNGQATLNLSHPNPGNLPLSITASSITPANNTLSCLADGKTDLSCSIDVAETGFIFDVPTLTACKPSADVTIKAVKKGENTTQCISALTGNKTLSFWSEYDIPATGNNTVKINGSDIATSNAGTNIDLNFDGNGEAQFTAQYDDAGQLNLTASYDDGNGLSMTGTDSFISTPVAIVSYSEDNNADCASQNASCSVFKKAGEKFNQTIKAACWTHDSDTDYTDNPETPNFVLASIGINNNVVAPASGVNGQLKENSFNFSSSDKGIHTLEQTISEVGVFEFSLTVPTYFTETLNSVISPAIGRFVPDHFKTTTGDDGSFGNGACTGFSYSGQTFSYRTNPQLIVTAYNAATSATITQNYRDDFAKLDDTDLNVTTPVTDANQLGADNTNLVKLNWQPDSPTLNDNGDGTLTFTFGSDNYTYTHEANSQIAPFVNAVDLIFTQIRDSDNINAATLPYTLQPSGENIYFGRVALDSVHGSELAPLSVGFRTEYFNGFGWLPNVQDQCTTVSLANHIRLKVDGGSFQSGNSTMTIQSGTTSATLANSLISGNGSLSLSAPGEDNQGYVDIRSNMSATHPWLVDINNGEAQSRASFGLFRGDNNIIFRRERY